jgi:hypothetical protein
VGDYYNKEAESGEVEEEEEEKEVNWLNSCAEMPAKGKKRVLS